MSINNCLNVLLYQEKYNKRQEDLYIYLEQYFSVLFEFQLKILLRITIYFSLRYNDITRSLNVCLFFFFFLSIFHNFHWKMDKYINNLVIKDFSLFLFAYQENSFSGKFYLFKGKLCRLS